MKKLYTLFLLLLMFQLHLQAQNPSLDQSFNDDGMFLTDMFIRDIAVQPDKKILVLGQISSQILLKRLNPDNGIDESFGTGGEIELKFGNKVYVQSDGKIIIVGTLHDDTIIEDVEILIAVLRLNFDGIVDSDFGEAGFVYLDNSDKSEQNFGSGGRNYFDFGDLLFQYDKILVGGRSIVDFPIDDNDRDQLITVSLFQLNKNGTFDKTFGDNGKKLIFKRSTYEGASEDYENFWFSWYEVSI